MSVLDEIDPATRELLERFGFDEARFEQQRAALADGRLSAAGNVVRGVVEPPRPEDLVALPAPGSVEETQAREAGLAALRAGAVAHVVMAGGMATRFGGVVKAVVDVLPGRSFLDLALSFTARPETVVGARIPTAVMTSFATDEVVREHLAGLDVPPPRVFGQFVSLRLEPDGRVFLGADGRPSPYGPGHGDLLDAIRVSGTLAELRREGVRHVLVANVDNLGARIDPVVVGVHVLQGRPMTVEVARKDGDTGGAPARVDGWLRLVEGPCFPPEFDQSAIGVFNTNTSLIDVEALEQPVDLTWIVAEKEVEGRRVVQLERLYHELAALVPTTYLEVPRSGPRGRFLPVKEPADLERIRPDVIAALETGG
jgi:UTP--glucose-1-phosphate uridylyltransferase